MKQLAQSSSLTAEELRQHLGLTKRQLSAWLDQAVSEGQIKKLTKPVRYRWQGTPLHQPSMFDDDNFVGVQRTKAAGE
jgi:hypothetical protein